MVWSCPRAICWSTTPKKGSVKLRSQNGDVEAAWRRKTSTAISNGAMIFVVTARWSAALAANGTSFSASRPKSVSKVIGSATRRRPVPLPASVGRGKPN